MKLAKKWILGAAMGARKVTWGRAGCCSPFGLSETLISKTLAWIKFKELGLTRNGYNS